MRARRQLAVVTILFAAAALGQTSQAAAETSTNSPKPHEKAFLEAVTCTWPSSSDRIVDCADGLTVTGDDSSIILLHGIPAAASTATITIRTAQFLGDKSVHGRAANYQTGVWEFQNVPIPTGEVQIDVYKTRLLFPAYPTKNRLAPIGISLPREPASGETPWIVLKSAHMLSITVAPNNGTTPVTFHVELQFQRWHVDTGGFYAFSWARDQEIVTQAVTQTDAKATPQSKVIALRAGDKTGPVTGVTFFFHPSNYPDYGFEFGMATNGTKPNSWFIGTGGRLRTFGDHTLLTIAAGVAHISVKQFPGLKEGDTYDTSDARLSGRQHYVNKPYVSLGLGVSFGGDSAKDKK